MSVATRFVSSTARPRLDLSGCVLYAPLWRPDFGGSTFTSIGDGGIPTHLCTVTGATWGIQGRTLDGTDDNVSVAHNTVLNPQGNMSLVAWVKPTATHANGAYIISKGYFTGAGDNGEYLLFLNPNTTTFTASFRKDNQSDTGSTGAIGLNTWGHVAATFESGVAVKLYLNGVLDTTNTTGISVAPLNNTTNPLYFGDLQRAAPFGPFKGIIAEVWVYSRILSAAEIPQNYLSTKGRYV